MIGRLGRLEEDVAVAVAVELASRLAGRRNEVALLSMHLGDGGDGVGPQLLRREHIRLGHVALAGRVALGLTVDEGFDKANGGPTEESTADDRRQDNNGGVRTAQR